MVTLAIEESWQQLAILAALFSVFASAVLIMLSRLFASPKLEQTAKSEMVYAFSTVILVMAVVIFIPMAEDLIADFLSILFNGNYDHLSLIDIVIVFLGKVAMCGSKILNVLFMFDVYVQAVHSIIMEVIMSDLATGFFMGFFAERITNTTQILTFFLIVYKVIYHILVFLEHFGMFFFTFGVLLRAFPPTRGAGAFIMALCVGLYFIFPLSYILFYLTMLDTSQGITSGAFCDFGELPEFDKCTYDSATGKTTCSTAGAFDVKSLFKDSLSLQANKGWFDVFLDEVMAFMNSMSMMMCFLPILALTATMSFILSTSSLFGATIPEVGRGLVKLI